MRHLQAFGLWLLPVLASLPVAAQDMIGVLYTGEVVRLDSLTGAVTTLAVGQPGKNCLTSSFDNRLWTVVAGGPFLPSSQFYMAVIDPFTGAETLPFGMTNVGDVRALAATITGQLFGIRDVGGPDELIRIDMSNGAVTVLGPTGLSSIQAMDMTGAGLRAWDLNQGLVRINAQSGLAIDPFPTISGPAGMQFMATNPVDNQTYVGRGTMHAIDVLTGVTGASVAFAGNPDLRGAEFTTSRQQPIGLPCPAVNGLPFCAAANSFAAGQLLSVQSFNHDNPAVGMQLVGFSQTTHAGHALPINLDPVFGTSGCSLHVSVDFVLFGVTDALGNLTIDLNLPVNLHFQQFFVQHVVLEAVPGGISFSNGLRLRPGL